MAVVDVSLVEAVVVLTDGESNMKRAFTSRDCNRLSIL